VNSQASSPTGVSRRQSSRPGQSHVTPRISDLAAVSHPGKVTVVLSLFPGIDLLGKGFEKAGFCVVRGPDIIFGGDIREFNPPSGLFGGVIGGPPCQDFSARNRKKSTGYGMQMLGEFKRVVINCQPEWWLMENVPRVPNVLIAGYSWQRIDLKANEFGLTQSRLRHFQFGHRNGMELLIPRAITNKATEPCCLATEGKRKQRRTWSEFCQLQGLPADFSLPYFKQSARYTAVGNGVPIPMAYALACAIKNPVGGNGCICGCARPVNRKAKHASATCRKRMQRRRELAGNNEPGKVTD